MKNQFYSKAYTSELSFSDKYFRFIWGLAYFGSLDSALGLYFLESVDIEMFWCSNR